MKVNSHCFYNPINIIDTRIFDGDIR